MILPFLKEQLQVRNYYTPCSCPLMLRTIEVMLTAVSGKYYLISGSHDPPSFFVFQFYFFFNFSFKCWGVNKLYYLALVL